MSKASTITTGAANGKMSPSSSWLAASPSKRWCELFFLLYSPTWIVWALGIVVPFKIYEYCNEWGYLAICLAAALPCITLPFLLQGKADREKPWHQRFWVKANVWIAIFSFIGNYFWTHYFYKLLGAEYTFPAHRLNDVPICLYFMTHAYFCFYHSISNLTIRIVRRRTESFGRHGQNAATAIWIFILSYVTAYMETLTIAHFPYYRFVDRDRMYTIGSLFYAIYFFVSFPLFYRIEENPREKWTVGQCILDSLAAGMIVTIFLDFWKLVIGSITGTSSVGGLPWI